MPDDGLVRLVRDAERSLRRATRLAGILRDIATDPGLSEWGRVPAQQRRRACVAAARRYETLALSNRKLLRYLGKRYLGKKF